MPSKNQVSLTTALGILLVLLIVGVLMGLSAEQKYGRTVLNKLPKSLTENQPTKVSPTTSIENKISPSEALKPSTSENLPPPSEPPDQKPEATTYLLPFSDTREVARADLTNFSNWQLKVARNEIYARHGRPFVHQDLACYFAKQPWYSVNPNYSEKLLSSVEVKNAVFILNYEKERESQLTDKDSGCGAF